MTFDIYNGSTWVSIIPYIAYQGLEYQLSDIDDTDAGRNMAGTMIRGKITDKDKWKFKCGILSTEEMSTVLQLISNEYITCRYLSPRTGSIRSGVTMYVGDRTATHAQEKDGKTQWMGLAFSLIER